MTMWLFNLLQKTLWKHDDLSHVESVGYVRKIGQEVDPDLLPCFTDSIPLPHLHVTVSLLLVHNTKTTAPLESKQCKWTAWLVLVFLCLLLVSLRRASRMVVISSALDAGFVCAVEHVQNLCLEHVWLRSVNMCFQWAHGVRSTGDSCSN